MNVTFLGGRLSLDASPFVFQRQESSAALRFAEGSDGKKWSDVFAMAKALGRSVCWIGLIDQLLPSDLLITQMEVT